MIDEYVPPEELKALLGRQIVIDTDSSFVYVGVLARIGRDYLELTDADAHDTNDTANTKEKYTLDTRQIGVRGNRTLVLVRMARVLSISALDDVLKY